MISNENEYQITKAHLAEFEASIAEAQGTAPVHQKQLLHQAYIDGLVSQVEEFKEEIANYERKMEISTKKYFEGVGNFYGSLFVYEKDGRYYWGIDGCELGKKDQEIPEYLYNALLRFYSETSDEKI